MKKSFHLRKWQIQTANVIQNYVKLYSALPLSTLIHIYKITELRVQQARAGLILC